MQLIEIPSNPIPENAICGALRAADGVQLRFARWPAPPGRKGTVCVFHGRCEFIEKYFETVRELHARGFAVATFDWRGQGMSDRALADTHKGHVWSFDEYATDLGAFMQEIVLPDCPPPFFALGHSMGASILLRSVWQGRRWEPGSPPEPSQCSHSSSLLTLISFSQPRAASSKVISRS